LPPAPGATFSSAFFTSPGVPGAKLGMRSRVAPSTASVETGGGSNGFKSKAAWTVSPTRISSSGTWVPGRRARISCISQSGIRRVERPSILATISPTFTFAWEAGLPFSTATT